ncbi:hypothetical protein LTR95_011804 [Oleoguttula sp. CCFEE 5521]
MAWEARGVRDLAACDLKGLGIGVRLLDDIGNDTHHAQERIWRTDEVGITAQSGSSQDSSSHTEIITTTPTPLSSFPTTQSSQQSLSTTTHQSQPEMAKAKAMPALAKRSSLKTTSAQHARSKPRADAGIGAGTQIQRGLKAGVDVATAARSLGGREVRGRESGVRVDSRVEKQGGMDRDKAVVEFLGELHAHFGTRLDTLSSTFLSALCRDFNAGTLDERGLYVGVLRLLINTEGMHLLEQFKEVLPASWNATDLSWLDHAVAEDCAWQAKVAGMLVGSGRAISTPMVKVAKATGGDDVTDRMETDRDSNDEKQEPKQVVRKKKRPMGGFRAQSVSHIVGILRETEAELVEQPRGKKQPTAPKAIPGKPARRAPAKAAAKANRYSSPSTVSPAPSSALSPLSTSSDSPFHPTAPSTPFPAPKPKPRNISNPTLSAGAETETTTNTVTGRIYPTRRAILSRPSKPYTHALCGATFVHPSDVRSHHSGKKGSGSCWVKHGSPAGREWDEDLQCKVRIGAGGGKVEVEVLRGEKGEKEGEVGFRGYRVRSWGNWGALLGGQEHDDAGKGNDGSAREVGGDVEMKVGDGIEEGEECEEPLAKKRKVQKESGVGACPEKPAALGLRARK